MTTEKTERLKNAETVLVTGSRDWRWRRTIVEMLLDFPDGTTVIHGDSGDADKTADFAAKALGFKVIAVRAEWTKYGKSAGPIRNGKMLDLQPTRVLAFCRNRSRGTMDCVRQATERRIPVELIEDTTEPSL